MSIVSIIANKVVSNIEKAIVGKPEGNILLMVAYLSECHVLLEYVPEVAKTMLALTHCTEHWRDLQPSSGYAGSAAERHCRRINLQPANN